MIYCFALVSLSPRVFSSSRVAVISRWGANKHNSATCGLHMNVKSWYLIMFLLAFKSPSFSHLTHLPSSSSLFQGPLRVFFKTAVIDIDALIKCRHLWLTETIKGGEGGEKKTRGLAPTLKGIKQISTQAGQVYSKSVTVFNCRGIICALEWSYVSIMLNIRWVAQGETSQSITVRNVRTLNNMLFIACFHKPLNVS